MHDLVPQDLTVQDGVITGHVTIPLGHAAFDGHFPERPILPGVAQLDLALSLLQQAIGLRVRLERIRRMKFSSIVTPGAVLTFRLEPDAARTRLAWSLATARAEASSGTADISVEAP